MRTIHFRNIIRRSILHNVPIARFLSRHFLKTYLALFYKNWTGKRMNYRHPEDLNQALIKLSYQNSRDPKMRELIPLCADKYAVRDYIASKGYGDTLNELYGVYESVEEIDFEVLPNQFVMKMNNASGRNWICTDKSVADWHHMKQQFAEWLQDNEFGWQSGEWQYALIKPRIVVEKYLESIGEVSLIDYKFQCYQGEPRSCFVAYNRNPKDPHESVCFDEYDIAWHRTENILSCWHRDRRLLPKPQCWEQMIQMARDVSEGFSYVRVDVYEIDGRILFGELTFTPHGNVMSYYTDECLKDRKDWI